MKYILVLILVILIAGCGRKYDGETYGMEIFNRALTAEEINTIMTKGIESFNKATGHKEESGT